MIEKVLPKEFINSFPNHEDTKTDYLEFIKQDIQKGKYKIITLDDDPTGTQTVHDVEIITDWSKENILSVFNSQHSLFYILTNSRSLSLKETKKVHIEIAKNISEISKLTGIKFVLISRSDSTLRGYYPLEIEILKSIFARELGLYFTHEILIPAFFEGGRYTFNDIHWVAKKGYLVPCAKTEFADDPFFSYKNSNLKKWVQEKSENKIKEKDIISISIKDLRTGNLGWIKQTLMNSMHKIVIVNAIDYKDLEVFTCGCILAEKEGVQPIFRTAASFVRVRGAIADRKILTSEDILGKSTQNQIGAEIIIAGSVVEKTTQQINCLLEKEKQVKPVIMDVKNLIRHNSKEIDMVVKKSLSLISENKTPLIYTSREIIPSNHLGIEINKIISKGLAKTVEKFLKSEIKIKYIITKGGITSSDIATKALKIKKAVVMGQIYPGIPVWKTIIPERIKNLPLIIFPGNVGRKDTLLKIFRKLHK